MNGNYYLTKLKIKLKEEKVFLWVVSIILFLINYDISSHFFSLNKGKDLNTVLFDMQIFQVFMGNKRPEPSPHSMGMFYLWIYYYAVALIACRAYAKWGYEFFIKKQTFAPKKLLPEDIAIPNFPYDQDKLQLIVGLKHKESKLDLVESPKWITIPEKGLHQDILICGGKGTGKTQGCMYPFTKQMIYYKAYSLDEKAGMLILDVKGNYTKESLKCAQEVNRDADVIVMNLSGKYKYNPLYKPTLRPQVIANRLRTVLELFSTQHADSYWLDKAEVLLTQSIKLARLYNKGGYLTFLDVHKIVNNDDFLNEKIEYLQELEDRNKLTRDQKANFRTVKDYFQNEYKTLDTKISSVIKSEVTRMTQTFIDDPDILNTFSSPEDELNFFGFDDLVDTGKIVVLDMNIAEFRNLSKIIAAYLKLDFQTAALMRLTRDTANKVRPLVFISDEYQEYVTANDADFYAVSREAKCISIVSTQSYSSLLRTLKSEEVLQTILTNLTNKIWLKTDDKKTAEGAVAQCGTIKKKEVQKAFSKSGGKGYSNLLGRGLSKGETSYSENYNINVKSTNKFEIETFTIELPIFKAVAYLSDGDKILSPTMIHIEPYFSDTYVNLSKRAKPALKDTENSIKSASDGTEKSENEIRDTFDFEKSAVTEPQIAKSVQTEREFLLDDLDTDIKDNKADDLGFDGFDDIEFEKNDLSNPFDDTDINKKDDMSNSFDDNTFDKKDDASNPLDEVDIKTEDNHTELEKPVISSNPFEDDDFEPKNKLSEWHSGNNSSKNSKEKSSNNSDSKSSNNSSDSSSSTLKYIDKEVEEKLKKIEGIFDED